ncbi:acetyltransferase (GNAT) family protein [Pseudoduganella flava]|uniref:Acetyltransferase (GNAT) family protein n=1 Tax=Pseudoduganella flava TaxID=871742 RepID=A0A562Q095_9BURK|nr:GNAT family N-acetyltransferase [Pseudoduganella flava]QGZ38368.1 GNAT family N-acetyltransferase [Pseudoduganella flava]TWI50087.1 acetyltransferase (GNAT) family protein [Pseudoduganella flava]
MSAHPYDASLARPVEGWLRARSIARGLPAPVPDRGGWRVDTGSADELRRHVFAAACPGLQALAGEIDAPRIFLKLCGEAEVMRALLPPRWVLQEPRYLMTLDGPMSGAPALPPGYAIARREHGTVTQVCVRTLAGELAASGWAAEVAGFHVYDRIATEPAHRRRGLASAVMHALTAARRHATAEQVLVATADGAALYRALGWRVRSPYTTACIPA